MAEKNIRERLLVVIFDPVTAAGASGSGKREKIIALLISGSAEKEELA
jgi:hypothetical protein